MLTPSTPFGVSAGRFTSLRVVKSSVSAGHAIYWVGFDSRQLHNQTAGQRYYPSHANTQFYSKVV